MPHILLQLRSSSLLSGASSYSSPFTLWVTGTGELIWGESPPPSPTFPLLEASLIVIWICTINPFASLVSLSPESFLPFGFDEWIKMTFVGRWFTFTDVSSHLWFVRPLLGLFMWFCFYTLLVIQLIELWSSKIYHRLGVYVLFFLSKILILVEWPLRDSRTCPEWIVHVTPWSEVLAVNLPTYKKHRLVTHLPTGRLLWLFRCCFRPRYITFLKSKHFEFPEHLAVRFWGKVLETCIITSFFRCRIQGVRRLWVTVSRWCLPLCSGVCVRTPGLLLRAAAPCDGHALIFLAMGAALLKTSSHMSSI